MNRLEKRQNLGQGDRSVLGVALDVHMTNTGSLERPVEDQEQDIQLLRCVIQTWERSPLFAFERFDTAVYNLVRAALLEAGDAWFPARVSKTPVHERPESSRFDKFLKKR